MDDDRRQALGKHLSVVLMALDAPLLDDYAFYSHFDSVNNLIFADDLALIDMSDREAALDGVGKLLGSIILGQATISVMLANRLAKATGKEPEEVLKDLLR